MTELIYIVMKKKNLAFICPLSKPDSPTRRRSDGIMESVLSPIAEELGYEVFRADKLHGKHIMDDIIKMLYNADIVVADLSDLNVNVFYELGLYHAIKGKFITIKDTLKDVPFDATYFRVYEYNSGIPGDLFKFQENIKEAIKNLEAEKWCPCFSFEPRHLSDFFGGTVVIESITGKKEHYDLAQKLLDNGKCKRIFLMQRSSSLILGAEQGWGEEAKFINILKKLISDCDYFYHLVTLEGIEAHFLRQNSIFPKFKDFQKNLVNIDGKVALRKNIDSQDYFLLKKLPLDNSDEFFKLDRQARVLVVEFEDGNIEAVIVQNLGPEQYSFHLRGRELEGYISNCTKYYDECEYVSWRDLTNLYKKYQSLQK